MIVDLIVVAVEVVLDITVVATVLVVGIALLGAAVTVAGGTAYSFLRLANGGVRAVEAAIRGDDFRQPALRSASLSTATAGRTGVFFGTLVTTSELLIVVMLMVSLTAAKAFESASPGTIAASEQTLQVTLESMVDLPTAVSSFGSLNPLGKLWWVGVVGLFVGAGLFVAGYYLGRFVEHPERRRYENLVDWYASIYSLDADADEARE